MNCDFRLPQSSEVIRPGANQTDQYFNYLKNKKIGLVVNQASKIGKLHLADSLHSAGFYIKIIFAPEHGFRGDHDAGQSIKDTFDTNLNCRVASLYGKNHKPKKSDLEEIDVMLFDLQDVGVRFYTYINTLHQVMEACAQNGKPLIVLDRPNPNGHYVDGPVLDSQFHSFVGILPIPIVYGLTIGELAKMIEGECWISSCNTLNLTVVPCINYTHNSQYCPEERPSPNLPNYRSILLYPSLCLFEGTAISVGRGTDYPFQIYGAPGYKGDFKFTPESKAGAKNPLYLNQVCSGVNLRSISTDSLVQVKKLNLQLLIEAYKNYPNKDSFFLKNNFIDKLAGTDQLRKMILEGKSEFEIRKTWEKGITQFKALRKKYLLYLEH